MIITYLLAVILALVWLLGVPFAYGYDKRQTVAPRASFYVLWWLWLAIHTAELLIAKLAGALRYILDRMVAIGYNLAEQTEGQ
jgi:hypothetical protein